LTKRSFLFFFVSGNYSCFGKLFISLYFLNQPPKKVIGKVVDAALHRGLQLDWLHSNFRYRFTFRFRNRIGSASGLSSPI